MARELRGKPVADALMAEVGDRVDQLAAMGVVPTLAIVRVGEREDDLSYERAAAKRCASIGVGVRRFALPSDCAQDDLLRAIRQVNDDASIHGCLLLRPLPAGLDEWGACATLDPAKDVDGVSDESLFGVFANRKVGFAPCTAEACLRILDFYGYDLEGARVAVVGRSLVIGKPVSCLLQACNATVTMCHTRTRDLMAECKRADIVVVASGHADTLRIDGVRTGQVVIDVGMNWDDAQERFVGDVAFDEVAPVVEAITPVPGGVGSVTTAVLVSHAVEAAWRSASA